MNLTTHGKYTASEYTMLIDEFIGQLGHYMKCVLFVEWDSFSSTVSEFIHMRPFTKNAVWDARKREPCREYINIISLHPFHLVSGVGLSNETDEFN